MRFFYFLIILTELFYDTNSKIMINDTLVSMEVADVSNTYEDDRNGTLAFTTQHDGILLLTPNIFENKFEDDAGSKPFKATAKVFSSRLGKSTIFINVSTPIPEAIDDDSAVVSVKISKYTLMEILSISAECVCLSWWSLSFYPQIVENYRRYSVIGLSYDFVIFNFFGYLAENIFNLGMYFAPAAKNQSLDQYPRSLNPVHKSYIFFSLHALAATVVIIAQCLLYRNSNQNISIMTVLVLPIIIATTAALLILALCNVVPRMDVLHFCSFLKFAFTFTKYLPQVYMFEKRKTTLGFSMLSAASDFMGGFFRAAHMLMDAYNYEVWAFLSEDSIKYGLGVVSMAFNGIFFFQRYFLFRTDDDNARNAGGIEMRTFRARS